MWTNIRDKHAKFMKSITFGASTFVIEVKVIQELPIPTDVKQLRTFLGIVAYVRKFILHCSELTAPLSNLLKKDEPFVWTEQCEVNFLTLKQKLLSAQILQYPDPTKDY